MVKDVILIYRIHETILILRSYFSYSQKTKQYLTKAVLNFGDAL